MNGPLRQGIHPAGGIAQSQNSMLGLGNPPFMQTPPHMGQPSLSQGIGVPQNINPTNPPMGMLSGGPVPQSVQQRYPMQPNSFLPHQSQQQRPAILRQGQNPPQLNPSLNPPSGHVQNFHFPGGLMPSQVPNNALRRVPSQPLPNSLAHQGLTTPAGANVAMMNIQPNMPGQMRQTQHPNPQNVRMQPQQQPLIQAEMRNQPMNPGLPQNMNRNPSQGQVMNSLAQPPIIGSMQHPTAMQPPHLQNPFPNNGPMQSQHPPPHPASPRPTQNNPSMSMGTPGPSHTPVNRPSITPDNSFIGYPSAQFAGTPNRLPSGNQSTYPSFVPSSTPPMPMDVSQTSPALLANRSFSTQPMDIMNSSLDMYNPSLMPPPSSVPHPRPPSHTNPHPSPQQQQQQLQSHHQSPPHTDQPTTHPQRPQSQPQQAPGRPPSQTATRTPRSSHMSLPSGVLSGPLTATGRIPNPQQTPGQLVSSMPTIAPRPPNLISAQQQQQHQQQQQQPPPQTPVNPSVPIPGDVNPAMTAIQRANLAGTCLARLLAFSGMLANDSPKRSQLHFWNELVRDFFTPKAVMKLTLWRDNLRTEAKPFEIGVPILPRFFLVTTQSGVKSMSLSLDGARERPLNPTVLFGHSVVECINAIWTYKYSNGYTVMLKGPLTVHAVVNQINPPGNQPPQYMLKFEEFTFDANTHEKYILLDHILGSRALEAPRAGPPPSSFQPGMPPPPALPPTGPGGPQQQQQQQQQQMEEDRRCEEPRVLIDHGSIPGEPVNAFGIPQATMRCLELAESVGSMADLISFAKDHNLGPLDALKNYANKIRESSMAMGVPGGPQPIINPLPPSNSSNTSLGPPWSNYPPPSSSSMAAIGHSPAVTLYSSAPPSVTNPPPPLQSGSQSQSQIPSQSQLNPPSSMNSPQNTSSSSSANSPEKQPKTIPQQQQQQQQQQGQPGQTASTSGSSSGSASGSGSVGGGSVGSGGGGPATSPAVSSGGGGTTNNTPAMANTSLKRKQAGGDVVSSPTVGNSEQLPVKKVARRKGRTGTG